MKQFRGIQHIPRLNDLSAITYEYGLMDIYIAVVGGAFKGTQVKYRLLPLF